MAYNLRWSVDYERDVLMDKKRKSERGNDMDQEDE